MKTLRIFLITVVLVCCSLISFAASVTLADAIKKKKIQVITKGTGCYHGACLELNVKNQTSYRLEIKLEAGTIFHSFDEEYQDLMITSEILFVLRPRGTEIINPLTMCIQHNNASPSKGAYFRYGKQAQGDLLALANVMNLYKYQSSTAQSAVWSITDGAAIANIYGSDSLMISRLAVPVSHATGTTLTDFDYTSRQHAISSINTSFEFLILDYISGATLTAYDKNGNRFRTYNRVMKNYKPGFYSMKFALNHTQGDTEEFDLKLEANGKVLAQKHLTISDTITSLMKMDKETDVTYEVPRNVKGRLGIYDEEGNLYILLADNHAIKKGFNRNRFLKGRDLPKDKKYFFKVKEQGKTIVSQEIFFDAANSKKYAPITRRGTFRPFLKETQDKAKFAIYDQEGKVVWVVFENSYINKGNKSFKYVFQHRKGADAIFYLRLTDKNGKVLNEEKIKGKK